MLWWNKHICLLSLITLIPFITFSQSCDLRIEGFVLDEHTNTPISYATIYHKESQSGTTTDSLGSFQLKGICPGKQHLTISHIGCETQEVYFTLQTDTTITILLDHHSHNLQKVPITAQGGYSSTQENQSVDLGSNSQNVNKGLANMLEGISGVNSFKNGSGISKPIVHGLYGNRLIILNNGIAQSGQQWGVDHSPEIDPLVASRITVVKGVGALEYQGNSLGSVVLVEPEHIANEPHLHGKARYFFESNGLGHGLNLDLHQHNSLFAWRLVGTIRKSGDNHTPDYFLRNTGGQEANAALQIEKTWNDKWFSNLYLSSFNAELGILRGSHIGNTTDLESALEQDVPFFTEENFTYDLEAPLQRVNHHLLKTGTEWTIKENQKLEATYALQYNLRKEFDVRRGGRTDKPAMSLEQLSSFVQLRYQNEFGEGWRLKTGIQYNWVDNTNRPETGILPLIPDYVAQEYGTYVLMTKKIKSTQFEFGGRYDFENRNVATISSDLPRRIIRYSNDYHNYSAMAGVSHWLSESWRLSYNIGLSERNPEVNELYSFGLHQSVSGFETGDPNLIKEVSVKNTLSIRGWINEKLILEGFFYHQNIQDYIYLNPQDEVVLTIRGAFPSFQYEQTDARLVGFDLDANYEITEQFGLKARYSFLQGDDLVFDRPLVFMPSNSLFVELNYQIPNWGKFQKVEFEVNNRVVFQQTHLLVSQDFALPPDTYSLLGLSISGERQLKKIRMNQFIRVENALNTTYRNYLNRQRYFADDLGINVVAGINFSF